MHSESKSNESINIIIIIIKKPKIKCNCSKRRMMENSLVVAWEDVQLQVNL